MDNKQIRKVLLAISLKFDGDYTQIINYINAHQFPSDEEVENAESKIKSKYVTMLDEDYPRFLLQTYKPPIVLYYYGDLSLCQKEEQNLAVIGSRLPSEYGRNMTVKLVEDLCSEYVIVSGLAKGIDALAHETALDNGGKTVAVLGSGIDNCYPFCNLSLYKRIKKYGLVLSEYPNEVMPDAVHFPCRNRIISALCRGVLVTEAKNKSGTLITVNWALKELKEVMCIPYHADEDSACNDLIMSGAFMVEKGDDVRYFMRGAKLEE